MAQIIDLTYSTPGPKGTVAKFTVITSDGARHTNASGVLFSGATDEAKFKTALTQYAADQEAGQVAAAKAAQVLVVPPGKALNAATFLPEDPIVDPKAAAAAAAAAADAAAIKG